MKTTACILIGLLIAGSAAASYRIDWYSINSGGGLVAGGSYKLNGSIGQSAAGFVQSTSFLHWIGFWAGDVPTPTVASSVGAATQLPDGTYVSIAGKIATSGASDFSEYFYIEELDRHSGIRVSVPAGPLAGLARGSAVNVIGTLGATPAGERELTGPVVVIVGSHAALAPLGMSNLQVGGTDFGSPPSGQWGVTGGFGLNNVGLLVQTWGRVVEHGPGLPPEWFVVDDGSARPVTVSAQGLASVPAAGSYVSVIGLSSLYKPGADRLRLVLPRDQTDIRPR